MRLNILNTLKNNIRAPNPFETSLVTQMVKNLPAVQKTRVQSLGWEHPLKEQMTTHFSILAWRIPWKGYSPWGHKESNMSEWLTHTIPLKGSPGDAWKDWRQKKSVAEGEMVGEHQQLNGHELRQTPGDCEGQGGLAWCSSWVAKSWTWLRDWTTTPLKFFISIWKLCRPPLKGRRRLVFRIARFNKWK